MKTITKIAALVLALAANITDTQAGITYYHNDLAGSPIVATDANKAVLWRESYRPYGERTVNSSASSANKVWFTSRRQDVETGLVYMGARYYDPVAGRFVSQDPKDFAQEEAHSHNRYSYANDNPLKFRDPDGRAPLGFQDNATNSATDVCARHLNESTVAVLTGARDAMADVYSKWAEVSLTLMSMAEGGAARTIASKGADASPGFTRSQLQHAFKHAKDFEVLGNPSNATLSEFSSAIQAHVESATTRAIEGAYRGQAVTHYVNPSSGINVIQDASGNFLSGWKLSPQQMEHVLSTGKLGGG